MDDFVNVIKKDPKVRNKTNVMLDRYMSLPYGFQSKIGYISLIQNVILKELIIIMAMTINDLDIELKMKISRFRYPEKNYFDYKILFNINDDYISNRI